jgi:hypothetical protein
MIQLLAGKPIHRRNDRPTDRRTDRDSRTVRFNLSSKYALPCVQIDDVSEGRGVANNVVRWTERAYVTTSTHSV